MPEPEPEEPASEDIGTVGTALIALGLPANPICLWSEFTLATTGSGLPEGPGGALGAAGEADEPGVHGCITACSTIRTMQDWGGSYRMYGPTEGPRGALGFAVVGVALGRIHGHAHGGGHARAACVYAVHTHHRSRPL